MPHRIFFVGGLVVFITKELLKCAHSEWDVVSLALTCRVLQSPALSVLWAEQTKLITLIRVLPQDTLGYTLPYEYPTGMEESFQPQELVRNFSPSWATFLILVFNLILGHCEGPFEGGLG